MRLELSGRARADLDSVEAAFRRLAEFPAIGAVPPF
jgi:plasmid stabilization system protein ParE